METSNSLVFFEKEEKNIATGEASPEQKKMKKTDPPKVPQKCEIDPGFFKPFF